MGLFSKTQMEQIQRAAEKTVQSYQQPKTQSAEKVSKVNSELQNMEQEVQNYFQDSNAQCITDLPDFRRYVEDAISSGKEVGIDTETTGLDRTKDTIVGLSLYFENGDNSYPIYVPLNHKNYVFDQRLRTQITPEEAGIVLQSFVDAKTKMIFANGDFDIAFLYKDCNVDLLDNFYYDCLIASRIMKEDEPHQNLKALYMKYVMRGQGDPKRFSDFFSPSLFPYSKPKIAALYAANDAKITVELYNWQKRFLDPNHMLCKKNHLEKISSLFWEVEMPLTKVVALMHRRGMYLDMDTAQTLKVRYRKRLEKEQEELAEMVDKLIDEADPVLANRRPFNTGKDLNVNSVTHMKYLIYELMGIPSEKGKTGTGKDVLVDLNLPITNKILEIRSILVLINTFVEKLPHSVDPSNGRIKSTFKQNGASTGRLSSETPNLQNVPSHARDIRRMFRATPAITEDIDCDEKENTIEVTVKEIDHIYFKNEEGKVKKDEARHLSKGTKVLVTCNGIEVYRELLDIVDVGHKFLKLIVNKD